MLRADVRIVARWDAARPAWWPRIDPEVMILGMAQRGCFSGALFLLAAGCARFGYEFLPLNAGERPDTGDGGAVDPATEDPATDGRASADAGATVSPVEDSGSGDATACQSMGALADWWDPSFGYRRRLAFNNSGQSQALDDFVVLVVLRGTGATSFDYNHARPDGADLRFVDDDGVTQLAHHVERWQRGGDSYAWVRIPRIDAAPASDHVWLYHGNPTAPAVADEPGTYAPEFGAVFHLGETSGAFRDGVTGIDCSWQPQAGAARGAAGAIGAAVTVANEAGIICPNDMLPGMGDYTLTAWVQPSAPGGSPEYGTIVGVEGLTYPNPGPALILRSSDFAVSAWYGEYVSGSARAAASTWSMATLRVRVDGSAGVIEGRVNTGPWATLRTGNTTQEAVIAGSTLTIGTWIGDGLPDYFQGEIDEVRVSRVARSDDYLRAEYLSQTDTLITQSSELAAFCP
jgi:biopolymer transport protein ExbB